MGENRSWWLMGLCHSPFQIGCNGDVIWLRWFCSPPEATRSMTGILQDSPDPALLSSLERCVQIPRFSGCPKLPENIGYPGAVF
jgi:hypothetical protein